MRRKRMMQMPKEPCFLHTKNLYNKSYFEAARSLGKRSILGVCEHFTNEADAERDLLDRFYWKSCISNKPTLSDTAVVMSPGIIKEWLSTHLPMRVDPVRSKLIAAMMVG